VKQESGRECNIVNSNMDGRIGWFQLSVLKLEYVRRGKENGKCTVCKEEEY
jgi:hypothetical protein